MKYFLITIAMTLPMLTACVHHHYDGPGNSENAPGHNKHKNGPGNSENAPGHNKDK